MVRSKLVLVLVLFVLLAGCTAENTMQGQSASGEGSVAFNGYGSGSKSSDFQCDGAGVVSLSSNIGGGSITIRVTDDEGTTAYSDTVSGPGQTAYDKPFSGSAGDWTLTVTRTSSFTGQFTVNARC